MFFFEKNRRRSISPTGFDEITQKIIQRFFFHREINGSHVMACDLMANQAQGQISRDGVFEAVFNFLKGPLSR
jgi:hypothetical protein